MAEKLLWRARYASRIDSCQNQERPRGKMQSLFRRTVEWLFSPELFQLKLLLGTAVGVLVIVVFAVICIIVTVRNQNRDELRAHTIEVIRLSSVVENDLSALGECISRSSPDQKGHLSRELGKIAAAILPA